MLIQPETPTSYLDVAELADFVGPIIPQDNARARRFTESASRAVERWSRRIFYQHIGELYLDVWHRGQGEFPLPLDLVSLTGLDLDTDLDGTFSTDLYTDTAYSKILLSVLSGGPYWGLEVRPAPSISPGNQRLKVTGTWGWPQLTKASGDTVEDNPLSAAATTITVNDSDSFEVGQTILIETEQAFIEAKPTPTTVTVERGINGTTATEHVQDTAIKIIRWPKVLYQATGIIASRMWKRGDTAFAAAISDAGPTIEPSVLIDRDLAEMLGPLRRRAI